MVFRERGGGKDWERGAGKRGSKQVRSARPGRQRPNIKLENSLPVTTERTRNSPASGTSLNYLKRRETHSVLALFSQHTIGSDGKDGLKRGTQGMNHRTEGLNALLRANTN